MTLEEYDKAIAINRQIDKLAKVKQAILSGIVKLTFIRTDDHYPSASGLDSETEELLRGFAEAHSENIQEEITEKLSFLWKEIEAL